MLIVNYKTMLDSDYKRSQNEYWLDLVAVSSEYIPVSGDTLYIGISNNYNISWNIEKINGSYTPNITYVGMGLPTKVCKGYTPGTKEIPLTLNYANTGDIFPLDYIMVGRRVQTPTVSCLVIPTYCSNISSIAGEITGGSLYDWTSGGGVEAMRFKLTPGIYNISATLWDQTGTTKIDNYVFSHQFREISGNIINIDNDNWNVDVQALQWNDQALPNGTKLKWFYESAQGMNSATYISTNILYVSSPDIAPAKEIGIDPVDSIRFKYDAPGVKTLTAAIIDVKQETIFSTGESLSTTTTVLTSITACVIPGSYIDSNIAGYDEYFWNISSPILTSLNMSAVVLGDGTTILTPETTALPADGGFFSIDIPSGRNATYAQASSVEFIFYSTDRTRQLTPYFGNYSIYDYIVASTQLQTTYLYSSTLSIVGSGTADYQILSGLQTFGDNGAAVLPPYEQKLYWQNLSPAAFASNLIIKTLTDEQVYDTVTPPACYGAEISPICAINSAPGAYSVGLFYVNDPTLNAIYNWTTYEPTNMFLSASIDNCPFNKVGTVSALNTFGGQELLLNGSDITGNNRLIKWFTTDQTHLVFKDRNGNIVENGSIIDADLVNPVSIIITPDVSNNSQTNTAIVCASYYKESSIINNTSTPISTVQTQIVYDNWPTLDVDFTVNFETYSKLPAEGIYRFKGGTNTVYNFNTKVISLTAGDTVYSESQLNQWNNNFIWKLGGNPVATGISIPTISLSLPAFSSKVSVNSSLELVVNNLSAAGFVYPHCINKTLPITVVNSTKLISPSSVIYPAKVWVNNTLSSLDLNPALYWSLLPYPSAYGDGNNMNFYFSGAPSTYYDTFQWNIGNESTVIASINETKTLNIGSDVGVEKTLPVAFGGFIENNLENYTLSTYIDDVDGYAKIYPNWRQLDSIKMVLYDETFATLAAYVSNYDTYSYIKPYVVYNSITNTPVRILGVTNVWDLSTDSQIYRNVRHTNPIRFNDVYESIVATVTTSVTVDIDDSVGYAFSPVTRTTVIGPTTLYLPTVDFLMSSTNVYSVLNDIDGDSISVFVPTSASTYLTWSNEALRTSGYTYTWNICGNTINTETWTSSYPIDQTSTPYIPLNVTPTSMQVRLDVANEYNILSKTKVLTIGAPPTPVWSIYPYSYYGIVGDTITIENATFDVIPLSRLIWNIEGYSYDSLTTIDHTFISAGLPRIYLSAIDSMNYIHTTFKTPIIIYDTWNTYKPNALVSFAEVSPELPNQFTDIQIPPNEWVVADNFNRAMIKLEENLDYLNDITSAYAKPPILYSGHWKPSYNWKVKDVNTNYDIIENITDLDLRDIVENIDYRVFAYKNKIEIRDKSVASNLIRTITSPLIGKTFTNIKGIGMDIDGRIVVFDQDHQFIYIIKYDPSDIYGDVRTIRYWGGYGGQTAKYKFRTASDMYVLNNEYIYIMDSGNKCIKKYTVTGSWIYTYTISSAENDNWISISADVDGTLYLLTDNNIYIVNTDGSLSNTLNWPNILQTQYMGQTAKHICASKDEGIIYVLLDSVIIKYTDKGGLIGEFGVDEFSRLGEDTDYVRIYQSNNRNLYIVNKGYIVQYIDYIKFTYVRSETKVNDWPREKYIVNENEYVQDWVYNKCFHRFYDNLRVFKDSIFGRVRLLTDENGNFTYKLYTKKSLVNRDILYNKDQIYVGINELVTPEVVNRCLKQLFDIQNDLLDLVIVTDTDWRWEDTVINGSNPTLWSQASGVYWYEAIN